MGKATDCCAVSIEGSVFDARVVHLRRVTGAVAEGKKKTVLVLGLLCVSFQDVLIDGWFTASVVQRLSYLLNHRNITAVV